MVCSFLPPAAALFTDLSPCLWPSRAFPLPPSPVPGPATTFAALPPQAPPLVPTSWLVHCPRDPALAFAPSSLLGVISSTASADPPPPVYHTLPALCCAPLSPSNLRAGCLGASSLGSLICSAAPSLHSSLADDLHQILGIILDFPSSHLHFLLSHHILLFYFLTVLLSGIIYLYLRVKSDYAQTSLRASM